MSIEYKYNREIINYDVNGETGKCWDINNRNRIDGDGNQIFLSNEVQDAITNHKFILICNSDNATFVFDRELTQEEKDILDVTTYNHKNNI